MKVQAKTTALAVVGSQEAKKQDPTRQHNTERTQQPTVIISQGNLRAQQTYSRTGQYSTQNLSTKDTQKPKEDIIDADFEELKTQESHLRQKASESYEQFASEEISKRPLSIYL